MDDFMDEIEQAEQLERARDRLLELLQFWWEASEEVTVGLAA